MFECTTGSFIKVTENLKKRASGNLTTMDGKGLEICTLILALGVFSAGIVDDFKILIYAFSYFPAFVSCTFITLVIFFRRKILEMIKRSTNFSQAPLRLHYIYLQ